MKIVILDAYTANPGDLSWDGLRALGELTIYDRTAACDVDARMAGADIVLTKQNANNRGQHRGRQVAALYRRAGHGL